MTPIAIISTVTRTRAIGHGFRWKIERKYLLCMKEWRHVIGTMQSLHNWTKGLSLRDCGIWRTNLKRTRSSITMLRWVDEKDVILLLMGNHVPSIPKYTRLLKEYLRMLRFISEYTILKKKPKQEQQRWIESRMYIGDKVGVCMGWVDEYNLSILC